MQFSYGTAIGIIGLAGCVWACGLFVLGEAARNWLQVTGVVEDTVVLDLHEPHTGGWIFNITYRYLWRGKEVIGKRLHFGLRSALQKSQAEALVVRYVPGCAVAVYHHPQLPLAVLEPGCAPSTRFIFLFSAAVAIMGFCMKV